jgi:hypothetical protein
MNIASNPWSFVPSDVNTADIVASAGGLTLNADGSVTLTLSAAFSSADLVKDDRLTIFQPTNLAYKGFYKVRFKTSATVYNIVSLGNPIPAGTAASGGGTAAQNQYADQIRAEDISWQNVAALGQILILTDKNGNPIWESTASGPGVFSRGKIMWVNGLTLVEMDSGIVLVTVN